MNKYTHSFRFQALDTGLHLSLNFKKTRGTAVRVCLQISIFVLL